MFKTFNLKSAEISRTWVMIDASEAPLGRIATLAAKHLIGKYKTNYTPHVDGGDYVVIVNASKAIVTGAKASDKTYYRHSGFPGGLTETSYQDAIAKDPAKVFEAAIKGMLPKNKQLPERLKRLKVYAGETHTHEAQKPVKIGVK